MTSGPTFAPVDEDTGTLLDLIADGWTGCGEADYDAFVLAIRHSARVSFGDVRPNLVRPQIAGQVKSTRVGPFYRRACREGLIVATQDFEISDDKAGRNTGKPARMYRWIGGAL